ncbi:MULTISPECIES: transposase [unclassified Streptomyces]|uniref:transposase n=1 Tax=unclassified Streptomyces TaxID=2593676 RepID=UPI0029C06DA0|nr:transposase [Streptomyces sp. ME02-6985-2c]
MRRRIRQLRERVRPAVWVIDVVSFPTCGTALVGAARRYCGRSASGRTDRSRSVSMPPPGPARWNGSCI